MNDIVDRLRDYQSNGVFTAKHRWELVGEAAAEIARLRGTLTYILAQADRGYPTVLSVIKANAKAALDDDWQRTVSAAAQIIQSGPDATPAGAVVAATSGATAGETALVPRAIHDALMGANLEYSAYSCNGVTLFGAPKSIEAATTAFHRADQVDDLQRNLRHWREECGKLKSIRK